MQRVEERSCSPTSACCFPCNRQQLAESGMRLLNLLIQQKMNILRGKNPSKDCPAPHQKGTLPTL